MFADLDESLRQLLVQRGNLDHGEVDIAFDMPTRNWASGISKPTVNLYLYDIRENTELRDPSAWKVRRGDNNTAIKSRPLVRVDLTYRITAFANNVEDEHRLLARSLLTLLQHPMLPEDILQGIVAGQEIPTVTAKPDGLIQSPADYWGALDNDIKPSIDYKVTIRMDLNQEITVGLALTSHIKLGRTVNGQSATDIEDLPLQIGGRIHDRDNPTEGIADATVTLLERALDAVTDDEGRYKFRGVPEGTYTLVIVAPERAEQRKQIQVPSESYDVGL